MRDFEVRLVLVKTLDLLGGRSALLLKQKEGGHVKRRQSEAQHVRSNSIVHHALFGDASKVLIDLKDTTPGRKDDDAIPSSVQIAVNVMQMKKIESDVDGLENVALRCR